MKREHRVFTDDYIKHHDPLKAYAKAYPGTNPENHHSSAAKLLRRADIKACIKEQEEPAREMALAELQEIAKERIKLEILEIEQKRHTCALIVLGKWKVKRSIKLHGELVDVYNDPSPAAVLRAIDLDTKLEHGWYVRDKARKKESRGKEDVLYPGGVEILINGFDSDPEACLRSKWIDENPDKMKIVHTGKCEDTDATISFMEHTEDPPWVLDPHWYSKQPGLNDDAIQNASALKGDDNDHAIENSKSPSGDLGVDSRTVSVCVQTTEQNIEYQPITKTTDPAPTARFYTQTDTRPPSNKKKSYWEMSPQERWSVYLPLNTNIKHYSPEQKAVLERAYYNMSAKAQVNRIVSLEESAKFYNGITQRR